jgi:hypothetical protein
MLALFPRRDEAIGIEHEDRVVPTPSTSSQNRSSAQTQRLFIKAHASGESRVTRRPERISARITQLAMTTFAQKASRACEPATPRLEAAHLFRNPSSCRAGRARVRRVNEKCLPILVRGVAHDALRCSTKHKAGGIEHEDRSPWHLRPAA